MQQVFLKKGREAPVLRGHPWIFSGAIERIEGPAHGPLLCNVLDRSGNWLARGLLNPRSQIRVRVVTWEQERIDRAFFARRIRQAAAARAELLSPATNAYRVVNGEGDFLPGLVVDRYDEFFVCQLLTEGIDSLRDEIVAAMVEVLPAKGIYERSEGGVREEEGLASRAGVVAGAEPPELIEVAENGIKFLVDIRAGQKTGFFLDQRDNRLLLMSVARARRVLNCFAYTGAFALYAEKGGAREVVSVESSRPALELGKKTAALNGFSVREQNWIKADAFSFLKQCADEFDIVVLDPPSLAHRRADVEAAAGGYKFLNLHALRVLRPGGLIFTFSCSPHIDAELFQKIVFGAAVDSRRRLQVLRRLGHPADHPVSLHHPEGEYLKGLLARVLE
ncbi:MAG TPA: class I SAM-dependent rRNA methyltransferase [Candidatus Acidoferrales bacterium]|nr:class I SAM-dependent rRNA methyltransferase [Candidatus Acidoferrales bacterium]